MSGAVTLRKMRIVSVRYIDIADLLLERPLDKAQSLLGITKIVIVQGAVYSRLCCLSSIAMVGIMVTRHLQGIEGRYTRSAD